MDLCSGKYAKCSPFYYNSTYVFLEHCAKLQSKVHRASGKMRLGAQHLKNPFMTHIKDRNLIKIVI